MREGISSDGRYVKGGRGLRSRLGGDAVGGRAG